MQTLIPTAIPCYAAGDRERAEQIAAFLEQCGDVRVLLDDGEIEPGEDLVEKAREARTAEVVLIVFSHQSLPRPWLRRQWEDALVREPAADGTRMGFVRIDDCVPPRVLAPQFDLSGPGRNGLRELKRWIRKRSAAWDPPGARDYAGDGTDLERLAVALADRPGCEIAASRALAWEFVDRCREDFDEVFRVECEGRSLAALAGDWATQLGLRLEGQVEENLARLREFSEARRFLLLLEHGTTPAARQLAFRGRCSTLIVEGGAAEPLTDDLSRARSAFGSPHAAVNWAEACVLARLGRRLCRDAGRTAECYELMEQWHAAAQAREDRTAMEESAREMVWILEGWGRTEEAARLEYKRVSELGEQMVLPLWPAKLLREFNR